MNRPFFSIIIPTLNEEKCLPLLLTDLKNQTFKEFEVIIVDSMSVDKTVVNAIKEKSALPTLTILQSTKKNVSMQRNLGAAKAKGEYYIFIDADTRLPSLFLAGTKNQIEINHADGWTNWCVPDEQTITNQIITTCINLTFKTGNLLGFSTAIGALIGCRSEVFSQTGGFDLKVMYAEDGKFVRKITAYGFRFCVFPTPLYIFSFRRFRLSGIPKTIQQYAHLLSKRLVKRKIKKSDYPMGGHVFREKDVL